MGPEPHLQEGLHGRVFDARRRADRLPDRRLRILEPPARCRLAAQHIRHLRLCAYAVHRRSLAAPFPHGQLAGTAQPAGPAADRLQPGLCLLAVAARERGRALHRADHASRAGATALWRRNGAGEGLRLRRGGARRSQQICLDERRLPDGRQHQPQPQAVWLGHADPRRRERRHSDQPAGAQLPDRRRHRSR